MISKIDLRCENCDYNTSINYPRPIQIHNTRDYKCESCESVFASSPEYVNAITIELKDSDSLNDLDKLRVILFDNDTLNVPVGENVLVTGDITVDHTSKKSKSFSILYSKLIRYENREELSLTKQDIDAIKRFASRFENFVIIKLVSMIAVSVIGYEKVKEGILMLAANSKGDKPTKRRRIHLLLVGDPGLAKSSLLREAIKLVPRSSVESGQSSSGFGFTAIVVKEDESHILRLGPVPRARNAICV